MTLSCFDMDAPALGSQHFIPVDLIEEVVYSFVVPRTRPENRRTAAATDDTSLATTAHIWMDSLSWYEQEVF